MRKRVVTTATITHDFGDGRVWVFNPDESTVLSARDAGVLAYAHPEVAIVDDPELEA